MELRNLLSSKPLGQNVDVCDWWEKHGKWELLVVLSHRGEFDVRWVREFTLQMGRMAVHAQTFVDFTHSISTVVEEQKCVVV